MKKLVDIHSFSAGIAAMNGAPPFECATKVALEHGFDISKHRARQLTPEMLETSDRIFCMESWQANAAMEMNKKIVHKIALLGSYHPKGRRLLPIPDPRDFIYQEMVPVFRLIRESIDSFVARTLVHSR